MNFVFWNINDNNTEKLKQALQALSKDVDFLILAENDNISDSEIENLTGFKVLLQHGMRNENRWLYLYCKKGFQGKLNFNSKSETSEDDELPIRVSSCEDFQKYLNRYERLLLFEIELEEVNGIMQKVLLGVTHMVSKYSADEMKQRIFANKIRQTIDHALKVNPSSFNNRCILFGDFNLNPYDSVMSDPQCFRSYKSINDALNPSNIYGEKYFAFYNPCYFIKGEWDRNNEKQRIPGTFYYGQSIGERWNTFDQIIYTPESEDLVNLESISVITKIGHHNLLNKDLIPCNINYSDHLPIKFNLNI